MTPAQALKVQAWKAQQLDELLSATCEFDRDEEINGADFMEFFHVWRHEIKLRLEEVIHEGQ